MGPRRFLSLPLLHLSLPRRARTSVLPSSSPALALEFPAADALPLLFHSRAIDAACSASLPQRYRRTSPPFPLPLSFLTVPNCQPPLVSVFHCRHHHPSSPELVGANSPPFELRLGLVILSEAFRRPVTSRGTLSPSADPSLRRAPPPFAIGLPTFEVCPCACFKTSRLAPGPTQLVHCAADRRTAFPPSLAAAVVRCSSPWSTHRRVHPSAQPPVSSLPPPLPFCTKD